jgi:hypothetical protein
MAYEITKVNGVEKQVIVDQGSPTNRLIQYKFPLATIQVNKNAGQMTVTTNQFFAGPTVVQFDDITDKLGTLDIESYVDELANQEFFFDDTTAPLITYSVDNGTNQITLTSPANNYGVNFLRLAPGQPNRFLELILLDILSQTNDDIFFSVLINPTINNVGGLSWSAVGSSVWEYADGIGGPGGSATTLTGGEKVASGYVRRNTDKTLELDKKIEVSDSDLIVLGCQPFAANADVSGALKFTDELIP